MNVLTNFYFLLLSLNFKMFFFIFIINLKSFLDLMPIKMIFEIFF